MHIALVPSENQNSKNSQDVKIDTKNFKVAQVQVS